MKGRRHARAALFALVALSLAACGTDDPAGGEGADAAAEFPTGFGDTGTPDATDPEVASDAPLSEAGPDTPGPAPGELCPEDHVRLTFRVDDTANQTYELGELIWTGSFAFDETSRVLTYATSWLPDQGPYPLLYDDGPWDAGGHEPLGATAGDHIFGVAVCYRPDEPRTFAYGLLNGDLRWIWSGPNGQFEVEAGAAGVIDVPGMTIPAHGDRDFRLMLDLAGLHPDFEGVSLASHSVFVKGTMNSWTPVQLLDNGALGDEAAGDGVVTYQHSQYLGAHDGLIPTGGEVQFVFVFTQGDTDPDDGLEYKVAGDAAPEGVSAEGLCGGGPTPHQVSLALDSKGKTQNTAITVCAEDPQPECGPDSPCPEGWECVAGTCVELSAGEPEILLVLPALGSSAGGTTVTISGSGLAPDPLVSFGGATATVESATDKAIQAITPPGALGPVDVKVLVGGQEATFKGGFTYIQSTEAPVISGIDPAEGAVGGGTTVTVSGTHFAQGASVLFGAQPAGNVSVDPSGASLTAVTPPGTVGTVSVTVKNPDGKEGTLEDAFSYVPELPDWCQLDGPEALATVVGKASTPLAAQIYEPGVTDAAGAGPGLSAEVGYGPLGSDPRTDGGWTWATASYQSEIGNNDVWGAGLSAPEGAWAASIRASVTGGAAWRYCDLTGSDDGFDPESLSSLTVEAAGAVALLVSVPGTLSPLGGQVVTLTGAGFDAACTLTLGGAAVAGLNVVSPQTLTFTAPPSAPGPATLALGCPEGSDTLEVSVAHGWDGSLEDWPASSQVASNTVETDWGAGENELHALYLGTDGVNLYVGVSGLVGGDPANAIVVYVDGDFGTGSGLTDTKALENEGQVDASLGGLVVFDAAGFGAEVAMASVGMASYDPGIDDAASVSAGWRGLAPPGNMPWLLDGGVYGSPTSVEAFLPLDNLYGAPAGAPRTLGVAVRLVNADGLYASNQALPEGTSGDDNASTLGAISFQLVY